MNVDGYCSWFLTGRCKRGSNCAHKHFVESKLTQRLCRRKKTTVLVQCAWTGRPAAAAMHAWTVLHALLSRYDSESFDVHLVHEAGVYDVGKVHEPTEFLKQSIVFPWERYGPDRLVDSLARTISYVATSVQKGPDVPSYQQIFLLTYTGAVADYSAACMSKQLHRLMKAANVRVIVVGIDLADFERSTMVRLCTDNSLFTFIEINSSGYQPRQAARRVVDAAQNLHAAFVLDQYRAV
jgi:hypothetical protein